MTGVLPLIIQLLTGGLVQMASGLGAGIIAFVQNLFVSAEGALTVFGELIIIFAGISLAIGLGRWVLNFCTSLGNRNR